MEHFYHILIGCNACSVVCILLDDRIPQNLTSEKSLNPEDFSFFKKVLLPLFTTHTIKTQNKEERRIGRTCKEIGDHNQGVSIKRIPDHGTLGEWSIRRVGVLVNEVESAWN